MVIIFLGEYIFDADDEDNTRSSIGLELKSSAFEAYANYYFAISGANKVGSNTERVLDGYDLHALGQYLFYLGQKYIIDILIGMLKSILKIQMVQTYH